ncbi:MAG: hypothetical protein AB1393_01965 [Candidatus Edwardsbacteria bacterium]
MKRIDRTFLKVCKSFNENGVKYVVCGAYACKLHGIEEISGHERSTIDYDFIVEPLEENMKLIKEAFKNFNPEVKELHNSDLKKYQTVKIAGETEIDLISTLWQINYQKATQDLIIKEVEGIKIPVLSIDKLISTKKDSFRERDKADVFWLNKIKKRNCASSEKKL